MSAQRPCRAARAILRRVRVTLEPRTTSEVLDLSFGILRNHFLPFGLHAFLTVVGPNSLAALLVLPALQAMGRAEATPLQSLTVAVYYLVLFVAWPVAGHSISHRIWSSVKGESFSVKREILAAIRKIPELFLTCFVLSIGLLGMWTLAVLFTVLPAVALGRVMGGGPPGAVLLTVIVAVVMVGAFGLASSFVFIPQVVAIEGAWGLTAIRRCWELGRGARLRIVGVCMATWLLMMIMSVPAVFLNRIAPVLGFAVGGLAQAAAVAFALIAVTLLYLDLRVEKDQLDLEVLADSLPNHGGPNRTELAVQEHGSL